MNRVVIIIFFILILSTVLPLSIGAWKNQLKEILPYHFESYINRGNNQLNRLLMMDQYNPTSDYCFTPENMTLADDAFHGSASLHYTEWWYFDATFDNGYSIQFSILIISILNQGIVFSRFNLYHEGVLVHHAYDRHLLQNLIASQTTPDINLDHKHFIKGCIDTNTQTWVYDIVFEYEDINAILQFYGQAQPWKGQLKAGDWWGVALPQALVTGTITYHNTTMNCKGRGYHDHNWEVSALAGLNFGWIWGRIHIQQNTITWSTIFQTRLAGDSLIVVSEGKEKYWNIEPDNLFISCDDLIISNNRLIPGSFSISACQDNILIKIDLTVLSIHHIRFLGFLNYWRFHVHCNGYLKIGSETEQLDSVQIAEFIRFR